MSNVPAALKELIRQRAQGCCEYCLLHEDDAYFPHEADHIFARKHRGKTDEGNLCFSCSLCNRFKGSDLSSLDPETEQVIPLFHPRREQWKDHFKVVGAVIQPLTGTGRVTVLPLKLNEAERVVERETLLQMGRYPCAGFSRNSITLP